MHNMLIAARIIDKYGNDTGRTHLTESPCEPVLVESYTQVIILDDKFHFVTINQTYLYKKTLKGHTYREVGQ